MTALELDVDIGPGVVREQAQPGQSVVGQGKEGADGGDRREKGPTHEDLRKWRAVSKIASGHPCRGFGTPRPKRGH